MMTWQEHLQTVLSRWKGTPYAAGQHCVGAGVDCRYFVVMVLDELFGITSPLPRRRNTFTGVFDLDGALDAMREIVARYPNEQVELPPADFQMPPAFPGQPGDIVLARNKFEPGVHPAHLGIVGLRQGEVWHASVSGVYPTSIGALGSSIERLWRPLNKESWAVA